MPEQNQRNSFLNGLLFLFRLILFIFLWICRNLETFLELLKKRKVKEHGKQLCCIDIPQNLRPRPDPFIYSQRWLMDRGFAVTWQNPDFRIEDAVTGAEADSGSLLPSHRYRIIAMIHNGSTMAAIGTRVDFEIRTFGVDGGVLAGPDHVVINIPAVGTVPAITEWVTPAVVAHVCLIAKISHPDDANPLNNEGQHNTSITTDANRNTKFMMRNRSKSDQQFVFRFDTYALPEQPMRAKSLKERNSLAYLRRLQEMNSPAKFILANQEAVTVTDGSGNRLGREFLVRGGEAKELTLTANLPAELKGKPLNVSVFTKENNILIGGITIIPKN